MFNCLFFHLEGVFPLFFCLFLYFFKYFATFILHCAYNYIYLHKQLNK